MTGNHVDTTEEKLTLRSQMSQLTLIPSWIERLALQDAIPDRTRFAMHLCLEEVLSNIIRHGYAGNTDRTIVIRYAKPRDAYFVLMVDDEAPPFNPLDIHEVPAPVPLDEIQVGGQGIHLLRQFADDISYEPMPAGNRLTMGFFATGSAIRRR